MGDVYVLRKNMGLQIQSPPLAGGMNLVQNLGASSGNTPYLPGQSQMSQMTQTPKDAYGNFQYQAPNLDKQGTQRLADVYGTTGMNQRMDLDEKVRNAAPDSEEGFRNAMAQQKVFETAGRAGEAAHRRRDADANALGILAGIVGLANAGAAGQDAFSGMVGAAGQYQGASQLVQGTSRGAGERAARRAANKVGVTQPQVAEPTPQVAEPTPRRQIMVTGLDGEPTPYVGQGGRDSAAARTHTPSPAAQALGYYGADSEGKLRETQREASNLIGVTGNPLQMPSSPNPINDGQPYLRLNNVDDGEPMQPPPATAAPVAVASPTPEMPPEKVGTIIANNTIGNTEEEELDSSAGKTIKDGQDAAKATDTDASMAAASSTNKDKDNKNKMLVGVV